MPNDMVGILRTMTNVLLHGFVVFVDKQHVNRVTETKIRSQNTGVSWKKNLVGVIFLFRKQT